MDARTETRDGILWAVFPIDRYATVKIQGSNTQIRAYFPENWASLPEWLKMGNAVKIMHTGGNRGRIELVGHGQLIPTAVPGGQDNPGFPTMGDGVLTGMQLETTTPASMNIIVNDGTYRVNTEYYVLTGTGGHTTLAVAAAHATQFRYDLIVIGTDSIVHIVQGTNFTTPGTSAMPPVPANHISLGWYLVLPATTEITDGVVNTYWTPLEPGYMTAVVTYTHPTEGGMPWMEPPTYVSLCNHASTAVFTVYNQYGNRQSKASPGYEFTFTLTAGNGTFTCSDWGGVHVDHENPTITWFNTSGQFTVSYTREHEINDGSPIFSVRGDGDSYGYAGYIVLLNELGGEMWPAE
jgi:hypothetical protein